MGWWKINTPARGQVDWTHEPDRGLANAIPRQDTPENHYNGDGPADAIGDAVVAALAAVGLRVPNCGSDEVITGASKGEVLDLFLRRRVPPRWAEHRDELLQIVDVAWQDVNEEYEEEWGRRPYNEEREGVCNFVLNPLFGASEGD